MDRGKSGRCMRGEGKYDCEKPHDENKVHRDGQWGSGKLSLNRDNSYLG